VDGRKACVGNARARPITKEEFGLVSTCQENRNCFRFKNLESWFLISRRQKFSTHSAFLAFSAKLPRRLLAMYPATRGTIFSKPLFRDIFLSRPPILMGMVTFKSSSNSLRGHVLFVRKKGEKKSKFKFSELELELVAGNT
jgi:hypothetical protein